MKSEIPITPLTDEEQRELFEWHVNNVKKSKEPLSADTIHAIRDDLLWSLKTKKEGNSWKWSVSPELLEKLLKLEDDADDDGPLGVLLSSPGSRKG